MGLDSVTLLVDVKKHFGISISDRAAERIYTVGDFVDCVSSKVKFTAVNVCKPQVLFYKFRSFFVDRLGVDRVLISPKATFRNVIQRDKLKQTWASMEGLVGVILPGLSELDFNPSIGRDVSFLGLKISNRKAPLTDGTIGDLVNWTISLNHKSLIDPKNLGSRRDVERIVMGIIAESCGVPIAEIKLHHSITGDLGID